MKKIILVILIVVVILIGGFFGYKKLFSASSSSSSSVKLGYNLWPGMLPFLVAQDNGYYARENLNIEIKYIEGYEDLLQELVTGEIDCAGDVVLLDAMTRFANGADISVVGAVDFSNGADGIMAGVGINKLTDLKGKRIAVEKNTVGDFLLSYALQKSNLTDDDVFRVNYSSVDAASAFVEKAVDAAVTFEPDLSRGIKESGGHLIFSSAEAPGLITDTLTANGKLVRENPEAISAILRAYFSAVEYIKENPKQANIIGAKYFNVTPEAFATQLSGLKVLDQRANMVAFSYAAGLDSLYGNIKTLNSFLLDHALIKKAVNPDNLLNSDFVRGIDRSHK